MIKIDRGPFPASLKVFSEKKFPSLADAKTLVTKAERELEAAIAYFTDTANFENDKKKVGKVKFTFSIYKDPELRKKLDEVFGTKCAYCEGESKGVAPNDVEHFRPKSEIKIDGGVLQPGYFWLAGDWDNLLISCIDCNRSRTQIVDGEAYARGKETLFPVNDEKNRVRKYGPIGGEEPFRLLLNPCVDFPEKVLDYNDEGVIFPRSDRKSRSRAMAEASIFVYALQRKGLVETRKERVDKLAFAIRSLNGLLRENNTLKRQGTPQERAENAADIDNAIAHVTQILTPPAQYLGMMRNWVRKAKAKGDLARIEQFGIDLTDLF